MSKHQIIYTSCRRGINGVNDGQQIYSYDASFSEFSSDSVKSLFTYQTPSLASGVVMTDAIARTMPQSFSYRRLANGSCAIVLNTYLGRDYMEGGRFGNHLSHAVIYDESDMNAYPCEFYGSETLRSLMSDEEVRSSERPPFLAEPKLLKGDTVSAESVCDFLCSSDRMETYKKMLAAMLSFEKTRKRVVICDSNENIIFWIAALQFALPFEIAINVNFTTYEYDPSLSFSQICGVVTEGTRYNVNNTDAHFTFDFFNNISPHIETEDVFFDFIDMGMSMSFDSIQAFHRFIREKLTYRNADEQYYHVYSLYCLFTDDLSNISLNSFRNAVKISNAFSLENAKNELACKLAGERDFILATDNYYAIEIIEIILNRIGYVSSSIQESIKSLVAERIITSFISTYAEEDIFVKFYSEIETICKRNNIAIPLELAKERNREKLLSAMRGNSEKWRVNFILDVLCDYAIIQNVSADQLSMNHEIGRMIGGIIKMRASSDADNGSAMITRIVNKFSDNLLYLLNISLNIGNVLSDLPYSPFIKLKLWKDICQIIANKHGSKRQSIYSFLQDNNKNEYMFDIYKELIGIADNTKSASELFSEQLKFNKDALYIPKIYETYYKYLSVHKDVDTVKSQEELLKMIISLNVDLNFTDDLMSAVLSGVPIGLPSRENASLISILTDYKNQHITGRLLLLVSGTILSNIKDKSDMSFAIKEIQKLAGGGNVNLSGIQAVDTERYIGWIIPKFLGFCDTSNDLMQIFNLFNHTKTSSGCFLRVCAKEVFKESKGEKEYKRILLFLEFLFNVGNADERREIGETLSKLGKRKIKNLDTSVNVVFNGQQSYLTYWEEIKSIALTVNPIFNNILNVFKRKKDSRDKGVS